MKNTITSALAVAGMFSVGALNAMTSGCLAEGVVVQEEPEVVVIQDEPEVVQIDDAALGLDDDAEEDWFGHGKYDKEALSFVLTRKMTGLFGEHVAGNPFEECTKPKSFEVEDGHPEYCAIDGIVYDKSGKTLLCCPAGREGEVVIPDGVVEIGDGAFLGCHKVTSLVIPPSVRKMGISFTDLLCENGCKGLREVHISDLAAWCSLEFETSISGAGWLEGEGSNPLAFAHNLYLDGQLATDIVIPDGVETINSRAFIGCTSLRSVTIPGCVTNIADAAFNRCTSLEKVKIKDGVKSIGLAAFANCVSLKDVKLPDSVSRLGHMRFDFVGILPVGIFEGCTHLERAVLPKGLKVIPKDLFAGCSSLEDVCIPEGVEIIGDGAFHDCTKLDCAELVIPSSVKDIGGGIGRVYVPKGAFSRCCGLREVVIPDGVERIGDRSFAGCLSLERVKIGSGVKDIGHDVFLECDSLVYDTTTRPLFKMLDGWIFGATKPLDGTLDLRGTRGMADGCVDGGTVSHLILPDGMEHLDMDSLSRFKNLTKLTIPASVANITGETSRLSHMAERGEGKLLETVNIADVASWSRIDFVVDLAFPCGVCCPGYPGSPMGSSNPLSTGAELRLGGKTLTEIAIPGTAGRIGKGAYYGYGQLEKVVIKEGVTEIGAFAFYGCTNLVSVTIPNSVTNIGDRAFANCDKLRDVPVHLPASRLIP